MYFVWIQQADVILQALFIIDSLDCGGATDATLPGACIVRVLGFHTPGLPNVSYAQEAL